MKRIFRDFKLFSCLLLLSTSTGCIYLPEKNRLTPEKLEAASVQHLSKEEVLVLLGEPNILNDKKYLIYERDTSRGSFFGLAPGGAIWGIPTPGGIYRILYEFGEDGKLVKRQIEQGNSTPWIAGMNTLGGHIKSTPGENITPNKTSRVTRENALKIYREGQRFGSVAFSPEGNLIAGAGPGEFVIWDIATKKKISVGKTPPGWWSYRLHWGVAPIIFSSDGEFLALAGMEIPLIWNFKTQKVVVSFKAHDQNTMSKRFDVHAMDISSDGELIATGDASGRIFLWEPLIGEVIKTLDHQDFVKSLAFSKNGNVLASASSSMVKLWDIESNQEIMRFEDKDIGAIKFSPDGFSIAICTSTHVQVWSLIDKKLERVFLLPVSTSSGWLLRGSVYFSNDGAYIAASSSGAAVYSLSKSDTVLKYIPTRFFSNFTDDVAHDIAISPDNKSVGIATNQGILFFNLP